MMDTKKDLEIGNQYVIADQNLITVHRSSILRPFFSADVWPIIFFSDFLLRESIIFQLKSVVAH